MIPDFVDGLNLPLGGHLCTWSELVGRFGQGTRRQILCEQLRRFLEMARNCGFLHAAIGGSFATAKEEPRDLDLLWIVSPGVNKNTVTPECAELMDPMVSRRKFGHDFLYIPNEPEVVEHLVRSLGYDKSTRTERGMVIIDLSCL